MSLGLARAGVRHLVHHLQPDVTHHRAVLLSDDAVPGRARREPLAHPLPTTGDEGVMRFDGGALGGPKLVAQLGKIGGIGDAGSSDGQHARTISVADGTARPYASS